MNLQIFDNRRDVADPIPKLALLWLAIGLVLSAVPFITQVPTAALLAVCGLAFWRYRIQVTGGRLPATWVRLTLFITAIGLNLAVYRTIFNMDAAMVLLLVLVGLKLLELRTERDFNLVAYLCYFLVLAALFYYVSLPLFLFQLAVIISITAALVRLHAGTFENLRLTEALSRATVIFLQALPVIGFLYLAFPRIGGSFGSTAAMSNTDSTAASGMSDSLTPGSLSSVSLSEEPVLRASFPETEIPRNRDLYWRGMVLTRCRGFFWEQGPAEPSMTRQFQIEGKAVKQRINLEPHNGNWIFSLDRPVGIIPKNCELLAGEYIMSRSKVTSARQYDVTSKIGTVMGDGVGLNGRERRDFLDTPGRLPARITELAASWRKGAVDPLQLVESVFTYAEDRRWKGSPGPVEARRLAREWAAAGKDEEQIARAALDYAAAHGWQLNTDNRERIINDRLQEWISYGADSQKVLENAFKWFRDNQFKYTTNPGAYEGNIAGLDKFLFEGRRGFCEHYAAALGLLLRSAGLPTRVILGYQGGVYNRMGNLILVRQGDAHAWNEVWINGQGWTRVDLTATIAPDRLEFGMDAYKELESLGATAASDRIAALTRFTTRYGLIQAWRDVRFSIDAVDYYWNLYILSYDEIEQRSLLSRLGLNGFTPGNTVLFQLLLICLIGCLIILAIGLAFMALNQRPAPSDAIHRAYADLRQRLSRAGVPVLPTDGPLSLSERAVAHLPAQADLLQNLFQTYIRLRYGAPAPTTTTTADLNHWRRHIRRIKLR